MNQLFLWWCRWRDRILSI